MYLCFEFVTLWRRDFPDGFYYAGYAHQGAAWLTFALALATLMLSWMFSGTTLQDARIGNLRRWAMTWSGMNLLLAVAVYNRLMIYVGYNGMTRMRIIGFFGITLVVVGIILVIIKIRRNLGVLVADSAAACAFFLAFVAHSLFPVDYAAHRYNVRQVQSGHLHPSAMIATKEIDDEGITTLIPLAIECDDPIIRNGVRALLAKRQIEIEEFSRNQPWHWTKFQGSTDSAYGQLKANESYWKKYLSDIFERVAAEEEFRYHAMQWY